MSTHIHSFTQVGVLEFVEVVDEEKEEFQVVCLECGYEFTTTDGDYCENCGGADVELAED